MLPQVQNIEFIRLANDFIAENPDSYDEDFIKHLFQIQANLMKKMSHRKDANKAFHFVKIMKKDNIEECDWVSRSTHVYPIAAVKVSPVKRPLETDLIEINNIEPVPKRQKLKQNLNEKDFKCYTSERLGRELSDIIELPLSMTDGVGIIMDTNSNQTRRILLSGPSKCGKTTFVYWIAKQYGYQYMLVRKQYMENFSCDMFMDTVVKLEQEYGKIIFHFNFPIYSEKAAKNFIFNETLDETESLMICETNDQEKFFSSNYRQLEFPSIFKTERQWVLKHFLRGFELADDISFDQMMCNTPGYQIGEIKHLCDLLVDVIKSDPVRKITESKFNQVVTTAGIKKLFVPKEQIKWDDIGGHDKLKVDLMRSIEKLLDESYKSEHEGIILHGPPGCGKTMLAKALSSQLDFSFISLDVTDILDKYQGESEKNVRKVFELARQSQPCILFIDEIDSLCSQRDDGSHGSKNSIVNTFLTQLSGVTTKKNLKLIVIGATNYIDRIDPAIGRSGRLGDHIKVDIPENAEQRFSVLMAASANGTSPKFGSASLIDNRYLSATDIFEEISRDEYTNGWTHSDISTLIKGARDQMHLDVNDNDQGSISLEHMKAAHIAKKLARRINTNSVSKEYDDCSERILLENLPLVEWSFDGELMRQINTLLTKHQAGPLDTSIGGGRYSGKSKLIRYMAKKYGYNLIRLKKNYFKNASIEKFFEETGEYAKKNGPVLVHIDQKIVPAEITDNINASFLDSFDHSSVKLLLMIETLIPESADLKIPALSVQERSRLLDDCLMKYQCEPDIDRRAFLKISNHWSLYHFSRLYYRLAKHLVITHANLAEAVEGINYITK